MEHFEVKLIVLLHFLIRIYMLFELMIPRINNNYYQLINLINLVIHRNINNRNYYICHLNEALTHGTKWLLVYD